METLYYTLYADIYRSTGMIVVPSNLRKENCLVLRNLFIHIDPHDGIIWMSLCGMVAFIKDQQSELSEIFCTCMFGSIQKYLRGHHHNVIPESNIQPLMNPH